MKVFKLESTITKTKNTMGGSTAERKRTEERDSEHEDQTTELT